MSSLEILLITGVLLPLASFVLLAFAGCRLGKPLAGWVATAGIAASCVLATVAVVKWHGMDEAQRLAARSAPVVWSFVGSAVRTGVLYGPLCGP